MKLKIKSDGTAHGTRVTDENGRPINGITALSFHVAIPEDEIATVWLRFHARVELDARMQEGMYVIEHPAEDAPLREGASTGAAAPLRQSSMAGSADGSELGATPLRSGPDDRGSEGDSGPGSVPPS